MSFNLRYYFLVSDNKQRNYNSMSGPPSKFVVVCWAPLQGSPGPALSTTPRATPAAASSPGDK